VLDDGGAPLMVTRKPNIILMTDGEPTMVWEDYQFATTTPDETNQTHGDGVNGETGVSLLAILTAAHRKKLVYEHYFSNNTNHTSDTANYGGEVVGFYTISLNDVPPPLLIATAMFPFDPANTSANGYVDSATPVLNQGIPGRPYPPGAPMDSMGSLLRSFAAPNPQPISFYSQYRLSFGNYRWQSIPNIVNTHNLTLDDLAFADHYFPANDLQTLRDAFLSITTDIQRKSYEAVTDTPPGRESFDGYLVFSDVLGEYMEVRGVTGLEFDGANYDRSGFGTALIANTNGARTIYENILYNHMNYGNMPGDPGHDPARYMPEFQISALIQSNIDSGHVLEHNSLKYYARANRDYIGSFYSGGVEAAPPPGAAVAVELFPMRGMLDTPVNNGGETDLTHIVFHVVTALEDNTRLEEIMEFDGAGNPMRRMLNKGDQLIRWYIPASLIPQRKVEPDTGALSGNELPIRVRYVVGLNGARISGGISPEYKAANQVPGTDNDIYFYANHHPNNVAMAFYRAHTANPFYQLGRPGQEERGVVKADNPTDTAPHVSMGRHFADQSGIIDLHWLGNNGRLAITPDVPSEPRGSLTLTKVFEGLPEDINIFDFITPISFRVHGTDANGDVVYRETVEFGVGPFAWNPSQSRYELTLTDLPLAEYRIFERGGQADGYILERPGPPELASITVPGGHDQVDFINTYVPVTPPELPALSVFKTFHGLAEADKPVNLVIHITGPEGFNEMVSLREATPGRTFTNIPLGDYVIDEMDYDVEGFDLTEISINDQPVTLPYTLSITEPSTHINITLDNNYMPTEPPEEPRGSLTITKAFEGLPAEGNIFDFISSMDFTVLVNDEAGNELYRETVSFNPGVFTWNPEQRWYEYTLTDLPLGYYYVYERGGNADGFTVAGPADPLEVAVVTVPGGHGFVHFTNIYTPAPPIMYSLTLKKEFHGLADAEKPLNFYIRVTGPFGFDEVLNLYQAIEGYTFINLTPGEYTIEEYNSDVPGFNLVGTRPLLPYTFMLGDGNAFVELTPLPAPLPTEPELEPELEPEPEPEPEPEIEPDSEPDPDEEDPAEAVTLPESLDLPSPEPPAGGGQSGGLINLNQMAQNVITYYARISSLEGLEQNNGEAAVPAAPLPAPVEAMPPGFAGGTPGANTSVTVIIDNYYTPLVPPTEPKGSLTISKRFEGLPADVNVFDLVLPITFLVVGNDSTGREIYRESVALAVGPFAWNPDRSCYEYTLTDLPLGNYRVYERGGHAHGYILSRPGPPETASVTAPGGHASVSFVNSFIPVTPPDMPAMTVRKVFHGLANAEKPMDFFIHITGPEGFEQRIHLEESVEGRTFSGLALGDYVIEEMDFNVAGFELSEVTINGQTASLPYTVSIADRNSHITITVDNTYEPLPEPKGSLTISKAFEGFPADVNIFNLISPVTFLVIGTDNAGNEIYRETGALSVPPFAWNPEQQRFELTLANLPLGNYRVYERGGEAAGYIFAGPDAPGLASITAPGGHGEVNFTNSYTPGPPTTPPVPPGTPPVWPPGPPAWPPGPPPVWPTEPPTTAWPPDPPTTAWPPDPPTTAWPPEPPTDWPPDTDWPPYEDSPPYTDVWTPDEPPTGWPNWPSIDPPDRTPMGRPPTDPPSEPPPGAQTGDTREMARYIILLVFGVVLMGSAVLYRWMERAMRQSLRHRKRR
jgi:hypothetical protein